MARMFNKFLVLRRDGTVPDWPYLVLGARDPAVPYAIRALADESDRRGMAADYIADLRRLAAYMEYFRGVHGDGDPDAAPHRPDDPDVVGRITYGSTVPPGWMPGDSQERAAEVTEVERQLARHRRQAVIRLLFDFGDPVATDETGGQP